MSHCTLFNILANLSRTVADDNVIHLRFVTILGRELGLGVGDELVIQRSLHQVDGASTESTAHDAATGNTVLLGYVVQEVEFLARNLVVLRQSLVGLVHLLTNGLIVAFVEGVAYCKHAVLLSEDELGTAIILFANLSLNLLKLLPCAVAQCLECGFRMLGGNVLHYILAAVAAVVVGRTCQFVLNH